MSSVFLTQDLDEFVYIIELLSDEKQKRIFLSQIAKLYGNGGQSRVHELTGISFATLRSGLNDAKKLLSNKSSDIDVDRVRTEGAGRKKLSAEHPEIYKYLEQIIDGNSYGDPTKVIHYVSTSLSLRKICTELLDKFQIEISHTKVGQLLSELGYTKQVNQKMNQVGIPSPHRDEQFEFINATANEFINAGAPVISVDTKKKENIGNFKNNGQEYRKSGDPRPVLDHDFPIPELGKVSPYGVYVLNDNTGFVNLGTDHDTSEFAVESIRRWWYCVGKNTFPDTERIYITCDGGGSNSSRSRLWKYELQQLADEIGLEIMISHYPPGTSKWNKVEHRLFCYISKNWQGKPLVDIKTVVELISNTTTETGLKVVCMVDVNHYETGRKTSDSEMNSLLLEKCEILGDWNYVIKPHL